MQYDATLSACPYRPLLLLCILELHGIEVARLQYVICQYIVLPCIIEVEDSPPILKVESLML